jgi:probable F420-dependent oxidoreductase
MDFGITMFPTDRALLPTRLGVLVESMGFESVFLPEHSHVPVDRSSAFPSGGELPEDFYRFHDPLESLAAMAGVTTRIRLGTSTLVIPDHDPIMLAKRVSTLDHLSGGRVVLGVGAGWNLQEIQNHGVDPALRWIIFRERVEAMKEIWTNEVATFEGKCVTIHPMKQWPKPVQTPHPPVLVGGSGPNTATRVLRFGDGWMASGRHLDGAALAGRVADLQRRAAEAGRATVPVMLQQGTPTRAAIEEYLTMGLTRVTFRVDPGDERAVTAQLERLADLVAPYVAGGPKEPYVAGGPKEMT